MDDRDENPFVVTSNRVRYHARPWSGEFSYHVRRFLSFFLLKIDTHFFLLSFFFSFTVSLLVSFSSIFFFFSFAPFFFLFPGFPQISFHFSSFLFFYWIFSSSSRVFCFLISLFSDFHPSFLFIYFISCFLSLDFLPLSLFFFFFSYFSDFQPFCPFLCLFFLVLSFDSACLLLLNLFANVNACFHVQIEAELHHGALKDETVFIQ